MKILLALISSRRGGLTGPAADLIGMYLERSQRFTPCSQRIFATEAKLLEFLAESATRTRPALILTDSRGKQLSSDELAEAIGGLQDERNPAARPRHRPGGRLVARRACPRRPHAGLRAHHPAARARRRRGRRADLPRAHHPRRAPVPLRALVVFRRHPQRNARRTPVFCWRSSTQANTGVLHSVPG